MWGKRHPCFVIYHVPKYLTLQAVPIPTRIAISRTKITESYQQEDGFYAWNQMGLSKNRVSHSFQMELSNPRGYPKIIHFHPAIWVPPFTETPSHGFSSTIPSPIHIKHPHSMVPIKCGWFPQCGFQPHVSSFTEPSRGLFLYEQKGFLAFKNSPCSVESPHIPQIPRCRNCARNTGAVSSAFSHSFGRGQKRDECGMVIAAWLLNLIRT